MKYFLYKFNFKGPVRFGTEVPAAGLVKSSPVCSADTFFSALSWEILSIYGEDFLKEVVARIEAGKILFSDLLPYAGDEFYIPKPVFMNLSRDKQIKKTRFLPVSALKNLLSSWNPSGQADIAGTDILALEQIQIKVSIERDGRSRPYYVGTHRFLENTPTGLYLIAGLQDQEDMKWLEQILKSLGESGIGGKRTSGYGRFDLIDDWAELDPEWPIYSESDRILAELLYRGNEECSLYMTLSSIIPATDELKKLEFARCFYQLYPRQGFALSGIRDQMPMKKKAVAAFAAGSCFNTKLNGVVLDVAPEGYKHKVYRYGKGLYLGLEIMEEGLWTRTD